MRMKSDEIKNTQGMINVANNADVTDQNGNAAKQSKMKPNDETNYSRGVTSEHGDEANQFEDETNGNRDAHNIKE